MTLTDSTRIVRQVAHLRLADLSLDSNYQRPVDPNRVARMAAKFNPDALGTLTVSRRSDGTLVIIDGQHRGSAGTAVGYGEKVPCLVYVGLSLADEAVLYLALNDAKQVNVQDRFRARVIGGEEKALDINSILSDLGWTVKYSQSPYALSAISMFEDVYDGAGILHGPQHNLASNTLYVVTRAWGGEKNSAHAAVLSSLGKFIAHFNDRVDYEKIIAELANHRPMQFVGMVTQLRDTQHGTLGDAGAQLLVQMANKRRRSKLLPEWRVR